MKICRIFTVLLVLVFTACSPVEPVPENSLSRQVRYITHAAGEIDGLTGGNSREALERAYAAGCRFIELDFNFTADGYLACIHDWVSLYSDAITDFVPQTMEEFRETKIYNTYTSLTLEDVVGYLEQYPDLYIITDIKDDNIAGLSHIADTCPALLDRFIPQIYDGSEYDVVRTLGFEKIIYTLYRLDWAAKTDVKGLCDYARKHPLFAYTFAAQLCEVEGYVDGMLEAGVPLYVHTVNGTEEQQKYFDMGITAVYTDELR